MRSSEGELNSEHRTSNMEHRSGKMDLPPSQPVSGCSFHMFQNHDSDRDRSLPVKNQVREGWQKKPPVEALLEIMRETPRVFFDSGQGIPEFRLETVGHLRAGFLLVIGKDLIEILLHQRVEGESATHDGFRRTAMPLQNSDSLSAVTVPFSISESRRIAS